MATPKALLRGGSALVRGWTLLILPFGLYKRIYTGYQTSHLLFVAPPTGFEPITRESKSRELPLLYGGIKQDPINK